MLQSDRTADRRFTYADYCSWPEDERWELIDGVAYDMSPAPARIHSLLSMAFLRQMLPYFEGKPCEIHAAPFDVRLPKANEPDDDVDTVVQPDILVVCDNEKLDDKGCRGAPDLAIEILSPSTASKDCIRKRALYEKHGVKEYWLVDPTHRLVIIQRLGSDGLFGRVLTYGDTDKIKVGLFPDLEIDLSTIFPAQPKIVRESPAKYL